jgi:hypothetical protein
MPPARYRALPAAAATAGEAGWIPAGEEARDFEVGAARATQTTQTRTTATAHMTRVKRRFMRPQSANNSGFMRWFQGQTVEVSAIGSYPTGHAANREWPPVVSSGNRHKTPSLLGIHIV